MKKISIFVGTICSALFLSGCSTNEVLTCTDKTTANGMTTKTTYEIEYKDNDVKHVKLVYDYVTDTSVDGVGTGTDGSAVDNDNNTTNNTTNDNTNNNTTTNNNNNNNTNNNNNNTTNNTTNNDNNVNNTTTNNNSRTNDNTAGDIDTSSNDDNDIDGDDIVDGVVGDAIDTTIGAVTDTILDISGIRDTYTNQINSYGNISGFTSRVDVDNDNEYKVVYEIDMDTISDNDLARFNVDRDLNTLRDMYEAQGLTCK